MAKEQKALENELKELGKKKKTLREPEIDVKTKIEILKAFADSDIEDTPENRAEAEADLEQMKRDVPHILEWEKEQAEKKAKARKENGGDSGGPCSDEEGAEAWP